MISSRMQALVKAAEKMFWADTTVTSITRQITAHEASTAVVRRLTDRQLVTIMPDLIALNTRIEVGGSQGRRVVIKTELRKLAALGVDAILHRNAQIRREDKDRLLDKYFGSKKPA